MTLDFKVDFNFNFIDFGPTSFYGLETQGQSHKPAYYALREAALNQPLNCSGC